MIVIFALLAVGFFVGYPYLMQGNIFVDSTVKMVAQAIAYAEGFGADPNNLPTRTHNPGDLKLGDVGYGTDGGKTIFPDDTTGWNALYKQVNLILTGTSKAGYSLDDSLTIMAKRYTGDDSPDSWANAVASYLNQNGFSGVSVNTKVGDLA